MHNQPAVETFEHDGIECRIYHDDHSNNNPYVEYDNASSLFVSPALARQYDFGADVLHEMADRDGPVVARWLTLFEGYPVVVPFYFHDYGSSGARITATDADQCSGFVVIDNETVKREWGDGPDALADAERCARAELETFAAYVAGDVYGFVVAPDSPEEDSCWGFYGAYTNDDETSFGGAVAAAKEAASYAARQRALREWWTRVYLLDPNPGPMPTAV